MTSPAATPDVTVAVRGVLVRGLISAKHLKSKPSSAMAQITLGIGNMEPSKLAREGEKTACRASQCTRLDRLTGGCRHKLSTCPQSEMLFAKASTIPITRSKELKPGKTPYNTSSKRKPELINHKKSKSIWLSSKKIQLYNNHMC